MGADDWDRSWVRLTVQDKVSAIVDLALYENCEGSIDVREVSDRFSADRRWGRAIE